MGQRDRIDARRRGFTLLELMIVVALIAIFASIGVYSVSKLSRRELSREAGRSMLGIANEARAAAILLGTARGTARALLDASCPAEFSLDGTAAMGTAALLVQPASATCPAESTPPCDLVTYVHSIERSTPGGAWAGDNYTLSCKTTDLRKLSQDAARMVAVDMEGAGGRFQITYDDRGLISDLTGRPAARITFAETDTMNVGVASTTQTVVILGSGLACNQGLAYECANN